MLSVEESGTVKVEKDGKELELGAFDAVVVAMGMRPVETLKKAVEGVDVEIICIGDSRKPGNALDAIKDGYRTALTI